MLMFLLAKTERMFSRELVHGLNVQGERPWSELKRGKVVTEAWLAGQLRPYGIRPRTMRIGEEVAKGYQFEDFEDTFRRYIPKSEVEALKADLAARVVKKGEQAKPDQGSGAGSGEPDGGLAQPETILELDLHADRSFKSED